MPHDLSSPVAQVVSALSAPETSDWFKRALTDALRRDCVDAAADALLLSYLLSRHCDAMLRETLNAKTRN